MNTRWAVAVALLTAGCGMSQEGGPLLRVYLHRGIPTEGFEVSHAETIAGQILADAGVRVEWLSGKCRLLPATSGYASPAVETVEIELEREVPRDHAGDDALAYTLPNRTQGVRVHVFMSRVRAFGSHTDVVLGHVLAHEIGHVLEGVARHSQDGVLKAHFETEDMKLMARHPLRFAPEDVAMIQAHFQAMASAGRARNHGSRPDSE
jgi:hypothetical protein